MESFQTLLDWRPSLGSISYIPERLGKNAAHATWMLKKQIRQAAYIHLDENSLNPGGGNYCLYTASTESQDFLLPFDQPVQRVEGFATLGHALLAGRFHRFGVHPCPFQQDSHVFFVQILELVRIQTNSLRPGLFLEFLRTEQELGKFSCLCLAKILLQLIEVAQVVGVAQPMATLVLGQVDTEGH